MNAIAESLRCGLLGTRSRSSPPKHLRPTMQNRDASIMPVCAIALTAARTTRARRRSPIKSYFLDFAYDFMNARRQNLPPRSVARPRPSESPANSCEKSKRRVKMHSPADTIKLCEIT